jgi:tetratricopeptide (TPR) repeat protein
LRFESASGGHEHAKAALVKSIDILNDLVELYPQDVSYKVELVETLLQTPVKRDANDVDDFYANNIQLAASVAQELATRFPLVHQYAALLAGSQRKLGAIAQHAGELDRAETHYVKAVDNLSRLVERYPAVTVYQIALAQSRQRLGDLKRRQGELDESLAQLQIAVYLFGLFLAEQRFNPFYHRIAGSLYEGMAETLEAMGKTEEAATYRDKERRLHRPPWRRRGGGRGDSR